LPVIIGREICEVSHNFGASLLLSQLCVRMRERQVVVPVTPGPGPGLHLLVLRPAEGMASVEIIPPCFILI